MDIGKHHHLQVVKSVDFGLYLDGGDEGEILLPKRYVPEGTQVDDWLDVFVYLDSDDKIIATTETPKATVDECAYLKVVSLTRIGAFVDWGLSKDLLVPYKEQSAPMKEGRSYVVYLYVDSSGRIAASSKLSRHLDEYSTHFTAGEEVDLMISGKSDLGYKAIINGTHLGLIYQGEVFQPLKFGQTLKGYIKAIREDKKIDLSLQPPGKTREQLDDLATQILLHLEENGGQSSLTDKSPPDEIYKTFKVSKGNYKKALGRLYKLKRILIEKHQITLLSE